MKQSGRTIGTKFQVIIGQLGKNYSKEVKENAKSRISGKDLLTPCLGQSCCSFMIDYSEIGLVRVRRYRVSEDFLSGVWLCLIPDYESSNDLKVMLMKIEKRQL